MSQNKEPMFKYKQVIRPDDGVEVITILHKGIHSINPTDLRFPFVKECIEANEALYPIDDILSHKVITPCKMEVKNHKFTILGEEIDDKLILEHSDKLELLQHLFLNLKNHNYDKNKTVGFFAKNASNIQPLTDDGFVFLTDLKGDLNETPIYHASNPQRLIELYKELDLTKKLKNKLFEVSLQGEKICDFPFYLLETFKEWDSNHLVDLLDTKQNLTTQQSAKHLLNFYNFYFKSPLRFINILKKNQLQSTMLKKFNAVKDVLAPTKVSNIEKLSEYIDKTFEAQKERMDWEALCVNHPIIEAMDSRKIKGLTLKVPRNSSEVTKWGNIMGNCFSSRIESFKKGSRCLFGLFDKDEKLQYVFELHYGKDKKLTYGDFEGHRRKAPTSDLRTSITNAFNKHTDHTLKSR